MVPWSVIMGDCRFAELGAYVVQNIFFARGGILALPSQRALAIGEAISFKCRQWQPDV